MEKDDDSSANTALFSPSFSTYSGDRLAEIADRVCYIEESDKEFEFSMVATSSSGDVFPVFNQNLISETSPSDDLSPEKSVTIPLKDLFLRERDDQSPQQTYSSSSEEEEEEEFDAIPSEIYIPWTPERYTAEMSPSGGCRKSKSTGSSSTSSRSTKRWRLRDLLKRSKSDGKRQSLNFVNTNSIEGDDDDESSSKEKKKKKASSSVSAHEKFYLRNKAMKEEDKRKSYLPYKQDLVVGLLFSNINRYGKTFPPF